MDNITTIDDVPKLLPHIDGTWWTTEYVIGDNPAMIKMREGHGSKIHIWNTEKTKVIKTFAFVFCNKDRLLAKAQFWINKLNCDHIVTQGRKGAKGSWCRNCGKKIYDVDERPCKDCKHFRTDFRGSFCSKLLMSIPSDMHVTYRIETGTCFELNKTT